jgi:hypothetical protein
MRFTPKSEEEIAEAGLLPKDIYDAEIIEAEETVSKAGNPMLKINVKVYRPQGGFTLIFDYLMETMAHKLRHCAYACGFGADYENGVLNAHDLIGRSFKVSVSIVQDKAKQYPPKNQINDYVVDESEKQAASAAKLVVSESKLKSGDPDLDQDGDDIPF